MVCFLWILVLTLANPSYSHFASRRIAISLHGGAQHDDDPRRRPRKNDSTLSFLAKKSVSLTGKALSVTAKQSGKAAYWAVRPKTVQLAELEGLWRMDQQVLLQTDPMESATTLELTKQSVWVEVDGKKVSFPLTFVPASFPKSARVEFVARAFPTDTGKSLAFFYKGYIHRKLADKSVLKIKGTIYRIERTGFRGKSIKHVPVGTFVARQRIQFADDDDISEEEYDDEEGEEEEIIQRDAVYDDGSEYDSEEYE